MDGREGVSKGGGHTDSWAGISTTIDNGVCIACVSTAGQMNQQHHVRIDNTVRISTAEHT
jgi:hypothetical protein